MTAAPHTSMHDASVALYRALDEPRIGINRVHFLGRAADALHVAGLHGLAAIAEDAIGRLGGSDSDVAEARDEVERLIEARAA